MRRTLFVKDVKAKREFVWQCSLSENITSFLNEKVGHPHWELQEELREFDKGETVNVGDSCGIVEDIYRTPFLLRERKVLASQRCPIYKVKIGEGVAYVSVEHLVPKVKVLNAIREAIMMEDIKLITEFLKNLVERVQRIDVKLISESVPHIRKRVERVLEGDNLKVVYGGIIDVLDESSVEQEMGALTPVLRQRLVTRLSEGGVYLPQVTPSSGKLGLTVPELVRWEVVLGESWQSEFGSWVEEGFSPSEAESFIKMSRDPRECALMRSSTITIADLVHG